MEISDEQKLQAVKDVWRLMYERSLDAIEALNAYEREAKERLACRASSGTKLSAR